VFLGTLWFIMPPKNPAKYAKKWRAKNAQHFRSYMRNWRNDNRDKCEDARLRHRYGITLEQYHDMLHKQGGACAICGADELLHVDHNHTSKDVRGLLCRSCNLGLGNFRDNPAFLSAAIHYLTQD